MNGLLLTGWITLTNPLVLIWGAVAAAPILIHLLSRRRYNETAWAATRFLAAAFRRRSRRVRIEQLILMAIRMLIVLLLVFAAADPVMQPSSLSTPEEGDGSIPPTHTVLVIDASFSMRYEEGDMTLFDSAIIAAEKIVQKARRGDGFSVILMGNPPQALIAQPAFDKQKILGQLRAARPLWSDAPLPKTLDAVEQTLHKAAADFSRLKESRIVFLTDFQNETWQEAGTDMTHERLKQLGKKTEIALTDFGQAGRENGAVVAVECDEPYVIAGRDATIAARIKNFGPRDLQHRSVALWVNGVRVSTRSVDVPARGERVVLLENHFPTEGDHVVEVRLEKDRLDADNRCRTVVPVRRELRALCVSGRYGSSYYVERALQPSLDADASVICETISESELLERDLNVYDCIFLCNVSRFSREEAAQLASYADSGGGVVFLLGDQTQPGPWNGILAASEPPVLPATIDSLAPPADYFITPGDYVHPVIAPWKGVNAFLTSTPIIEYFKVTPVEDDQTQVIASLDTSGDPLIVERRVGRGLSIMITTAPSTGSTVRLDGVAVPWSGMGPSPAFPALVQQVLAHAVQGHFHPPNVRVGKPFIGSFSAAGTASRATVVRPGGESRPVGLDRKNGLVSFRFTDTDMPGVYTVQLRQPSKRQMKYAVNLDPRESNLAEADRAMLQGINLRETTATDQDKTAVADDVNRPPWFRMPLVAVFVLLFFDVFLARRFGAEG